MKKILIKLIIENDDYMFIIIDINLFYIWYIKKTNKYKKHDYL